MLKELLWQPFVGWLAGYHLTPISLLFVVLLAVLVVLWILASLESPRYILTPPMTKSETRFFRLLEEAVPEYYIWPQVHMRAFLSPPQGRHYGRYLARINQKRVDWLLCDEDLKPLLIVELDDWSHTDPDKDKARDAMPASAGLSTIRFRWVKGLGHKDVREAILQALGG
jgi:very-short-patch-repair endonuclease